MSNIKDGMTIKTPLPEQKDLVELLNNCYQGIIKDRGGTDILLSRFQNDYSSSESSIFFAMRLYYKSEDEGEGQGTFISFYVNEPPEEQPEEQPEEYKISATEGTAFCKEVKSILLQKIGALQESAKKKGRDLVLVKFKKKVKNLGT